MSTEVGLKIHCCYNDDISHKAFCLEKTPSVQRLSLINCNTICIIEFVEEMLKSILLLLINLHERPVLISLFTVFTGGLKHVRSIS